MKIILASNSPRRRDILSQIGINYEVIPSKYKERAVNISPEKLVMKFAEEKAMDVAKGFKEKALIIGADTIVYKDKIMGKPKSTEEAIKMLRSLSGVYHTVITGLSIVSAPTLYKSIAYEKTMVKFKDLTEGEILSYVATGEPLGKAGAYAIQGIGSLLVEKIDGCYFNVVGLPIFRLSKMLETFDYKVLK